MSACKKNIIAYADQTSIYVNAFIVEATKLQHLILAVIPTKYGDELITNGIVITVILDSQLLKTDRNIKTLTDSSIEVNTSGHQKLLKNEQDGVHGVPIIFLMGRVNVLNSIIMANTMTLIH